LLHGDVVGRHGLSPSGYASAEPRNWKIQHRYVGPACGMEAQLAVRAQEIKAVDNRTKQEQYGYSRNQERLWALRCG
jgi:hypothetical protein